MLKKLLEKLRDKREKFNSLKEEIRMNEKLENMNKSANERELERILNEKRQEKIKETLDKFRREKREEFIHGNSLLRTKNIFANNKNIFLGRQMFDMEANILNGGNIFK